MTAETTPPESGEYRLVTIMFVDVVGSTAMGEQFPAETYRLIMDRCLRLLNQAVHEYGGTVYRLMGDGLLAFFGAPQAHEDDPVRAALASLRIHERIRSYAKELKLPLQVRVGINTGRVVMGSMGGDIFSEFTGMGMPVNLAARLESAAPPGQTLVGETTAHLIDRRFELKPTVALSLKGFTESVAAFELVGESVQPTFARGSEDLHSPLVGRDDELREVDDLVRGLEAGRGGICAVIAGPGIGKSRLLQEVREEHSNRHLQWAVGRAYSYSQEQAFGVLNDLLADLLGLSADDTPALIDLKLERVLSPLLGNSVGQVWPYLAVLLDAPVPVQYEAAVKQLAPAELNSKISAAVQQCLEALAAENPLVIAFDDLHWADQSTISLIQSLMLSTERSPILIILVFRPERSKPVWNLKLYAETEFAHRYLEMMLKPLNDEAGQKLIENLLQASNFPHSLRQMIQQKAEGNPFFVEELIRDLIERQVLIKREQRWEFGGDSNYPFVPNTVEGVILARLDRLPPETREVLQAASVIGRRFDYKLLDSITDGDGDLSQQLLLLQRADLIREWVRIPDQEYLFKHVLVQETVYQTLLSGRKADLHRQVAQQLEELFPDRLEEIADRLASHFEAAGSIDKAVDFRLQAGKRAARLGSSQEAANHLLRGLELLQSMEKNPSNRQKEMALLTAYGASQVPIMGFNSDETNAAIERVQQIGQELGIETSSPVLRYLGISSLGQGKFRRSYHYGQKLLELAERDNDRISLAEGYYVKGVASFWQGHLTDAQEELSRAMDSYDPSKQNEHLALYSQDPQLVCLSRQAVVLWYLGYPDQASRTSQEAEAKARKLAHPNTLGMALTWVSWLHHLSWDAEATLEQTDEAITYCEQENLVFWLPLNRIFRGWALASLDNPEEGLNLLSQGLADFEAGYPRFVTPYVRALKAWISAKSGSAAESIKTIQNSIDEVKKSGEGWCLPELQRLFSELLPIRGAAPAQIEDSYLRAIALAQRQENRAVELRAATDLCLLWQEHDRQIEALKMLAEIYNWFSEGFEHPVLLKARKVLDSLSEG